MAGVAGDQCRNARALCAARVVELPRARHLPSPLIRILRITVQYNRKPNSGSDIRKGWHCEDPAQGDPGGRVGR